MASLDAPGAIAVDTPALWLPGEQDVVWQITPRAEGEYTLRIRVGPEDVAKSLAVSNAVTRRSAVRARPGWLDQLRYPSEPPLPEAGPVVAVTIHYPDREFRILGWSVPWLVFYGALSIVLAFALRRPFRVAF
jgi:hypothetical protein